jgi:hypothetical protein
VSLILALDRDILVSTYTMGELRADGKHFAWTLEDPVRERIGADGRYFWRPEFKVPKQTAIPCGVYRVVVSYSNRFGRLLPELLDVPDFTAIRCHGGNTVESTDGCPLTGLERDVSKGRVWNCGAVVDALTAKIQEANRRGKVFMEVSIR